MELLVILNIDLVIQLHRLPGGYGLEFENNTGKSLTSFDVEHMSMISRIKQEAQNTADYTGREKLSERVIQAMKNVPRHLFVNQSQQGVAYVNTPLPIECGQTISQPFIVALMTDLLNLTEESVVLEIGTGSGYQAAILSELAREVYTIETFVSLSKSAQKKLNQYGYDNVSVYSGDGYFGLPDHAPYDGIIVTAVATEVPQPLLDQLKPGGRMVIPVGEQFSNQNLLLIKKSETNNIEQQIILPVIFVPLTRNKHDQTRLINLEDDFLDQDQGIIDEISEDT